MIIAAKLYESLGFEIESLGENEDNNQETIARLQLFE
jgi:ribosomal protein S18 acetylase RimI-like enzyme